MRQVFSILAIFSLICSLCQGQLLVDFNSTTQDSGPTNDTAGGFEPYDAGHEQPGDFVTMNYSAFDATIGVTPSWPNTDDARVQQMIDRTADWDANWGDATTDLEASPVPILGIDFVTDFIGIDTRTGNGGNGDWDGTTGEPTYLNIALSGLPAAQYLWQSAHIDTEHVHGDFAVNLSTDGGASYSALDPGRMVDAAEGGNPDSIVSTFQSALATDSLNAALEGGIYSAEFTADGTNDVILQFAPLSQTAVHRQIFGVNGFVLQVVPEPSSNLLSILAVAGLAVVARRRRR